VYNKCKNFLTVNILLIKSCLCQNWPPNQIQLVVKKNHIFAQDEYRRIKEEIQNKSAVNKRNTNENIKTDTT
jgi:hypothetical protein